MERWPDLRGTQTRPGGVIVTAWGPDYHNGVLAALTVASDGTASGRLSGNLAFMRLRAQQDTVCSLDEGETTTSLWVYEVAGEFSGPLIVGLLVPRCHKIVEDDPDARGSAATGTATAMPTSMADQTTNWA